MKTVKSILILVFFYQFSVPIAFFRNEVMGQDNGDLTDHNRKGTAIVITGAAARIPQEAALLEQLYKSGELKDVSFISGASSGALNTVVLNAILSGRISWKQYKSILFSITNAQVFIRKTSELPLDTDPLRKLIGRIVNDSLRYYKVGDLPFASAISATNVQIKALEGRTLRFSNRDINPESNPELDLVDVLMASAAIPLVFPPVRLNLPDISHQVTFIDGGVAEDHIPFEAAREFEKQTGIEFERMIIVSRKNIPETDIEPELKNMGIKDTKLLEKLGVSVQKFSKVGFIKKLIYLQLSDPELAARTYVYVPDFEKDFPMLDFSNFKEQYRVSSIWAVSHKPIPLEQYISENLIYK
jgi:predicted acylesterase/phospholipase RssA